MKNHSFYILKDVLYLGCAAWSAEWLSVARSPFIVNKGLGLEQKLDRIVANFVCMFWLKLSLPK